MNQAAHAIGEEYVHLAWFDDGRHFTFSKIWVHDRLSASISARAIIGCARVGRRPARGAALKRHAGSADRATDARNLSALGHHRYDVTALFSASQTHLFDSVSDGVGLFVCHFGTP